MYLESTILSRNRGKFYFVGKCKKSFKNFFEHAKQKNGRELIDIYAVERCFEIEVRWSFWIKQRELKFTNVITIEKNPKCIKTCKSHVLYLRESARRKRFEYFLPF